MSRPYVRVEPYKRPYVTLYYHKPTDRSPAFVSRGFAASPAGAIRAAVLRVFLGQYGKAVVVHRGSIVHTLRASAHGLQVVNATEE